MKRFMEITFFITFALLAVLSIYIDNLIVVIGSITFFLLFLRSADHPGKISQSPYEMNVTKEQIEGRRYRPKIYEELLNTASRAASLWHTPDERPEWFPVLTFEYDDDDDPADPFNTQHYTDSTSYMHTLTAWPGYIKAWAYVDDLLKLAPIPDWWIKNAEACYICNRPIKEDQESCLYEGDTVHMDCYADKAGEE